MGSRLATNSFLVDDKMALNYATNELILFAYFESTNQNQ